MSYKEIFNAEERKALKPYFTNLDGPVFAVINLPEVVKGALFARYSRSSKSLRRLFLDEFCDDQKRAKKRKVSVGEVKAEKLYDRVFIDYGDDSIAQLGAVHLACENVSNILTKVLEWGRLMAYLEQSTRYVPYTNLSGVRRYLIPVELENNSSLRSQYQKVLDKAFQTYTDLLEPMQNYLSQKYPIDPGISENVYNRANRSKTLDILRCLLPTATQSNVGIFGSGQAYEILLLRMRAHPLIEVQRYADLMLIELRKVIPAFIKRVDDPDRGQLWTEYLGTTNRSTKSIADRLLKNTYPESRSEVNLSDFDPDGELKVVAAALYSVSNLPDDQLLSIVRRMSSGERTKILVSYVGKRKNRRHKPGRAFERTIYRFDILSDYGVFRDLQRHRLLTLECQALSINNGYTIPDEIEEAGFIDRWKRVMEDTATLYIRLCKQGLDDIAPYALPMAYRVRFYMQMNAREAMHIIELRTSPQGHPTYRRICQQMHKLIAEKAGHTAIANSISFINFSEVEFGRLQSEKMTEMRKQNNKK